MGAGRWIGRGALLVAGLSVVGVVVLDQFALPWTEALLRRRAAEAGVRLEPHLEAVGVGGAVVSSLTVTVPGAELNTGEVEIRWTLPEVWHGRVATVAIGDVEARVDLAHWEQQIAAESPSPPVALARTSEAPPLAMTGAGGMLPIVAATGGRTPTPPVEPLAWWWEPMPWDDVRVDLKSLDLRYDEASLALHGSLGWLEGEGERTIDWSLEGDALALRGRLQVAPPERTWSAEGSWQGTHPLDVVRALLPEGHRWRPENLWGEKVQSVRVGAANLSGWAEGRDRSVERASLLWHQGPVQVVLSDGLSVLVRGASLAATRDGAQWRKGEAVFDVDAIAAGPGRLEPFMTNLGWTAQGGWRVEVPHLAYAAEEPALEVELAARGFYRPDGAAELQLAFSRLVAKDVPLNPFRWFLNAREGQLQGRLSDLSSGNWPDWHLVQAAFTVDGVPQPGKAPEPWHVSGSSEVEYRPQARKMGKLGFDLTPRAPGAEPGAPLVCEVAARLDGEIGERLVDLSAAVSTEGGFSAAAWGDWALIDAVPYLFPFFPEIRGMRAGGHLRWEAKAESEGFFGFRTELKAGLEGASLKLPDDGPEISGIEGDFTFTSHGTMAASQGVQELRIREIRMGDRSLTDLVVRFRLVHKQALEVLACEGQWMGGRVSVEPFTVDPLHPRIATTVRMSGVEARQLFPNPEATGFLIDARLSGTVPFTYDPESGPQPGEGILEALNPADAALIVTNPKSLERYLPLPQTALKIKEKVLDGITRHFRFHSIRVEVFNPATPLTAMVVDFEGGVKTADVDMPSIRIKVPQNFERPLKGWESLLILFSGGTIGL